jgi:hypothetical protein
MDIEQLTPEQAQRLWSEMEDEEQSNGTNGQKADDLPPEPGPDHVAAETANNGGPAAGDPYAGLSEELRNRMIGLERQAQYAQQEKSHMQQALRQQMGHRQQLASAQAGQHMPQEQMQALNALQRSHPELAGVLTRYLASATQGLRAELANRQAASGISRQEFERALQENVIEARHPGWRNDVQRPEFVGWMQQQPGEIQALGSSEKAADAIRLLDLYRTPQQQDTQRNNRLAAQASIPSGRFGSGRGKPADEMTDAEYWAYLDRQDKKGK